jgi:hypothetical protein
MTQKQYDRLRRQRPHWHLPEWRWIRAEYRQQLGATSMKLFLTQISAELLAGGSYRDTEIYKMGFPEVPF